MKRIKQCCEEFVDGKCRPMVNADWTYLRCECGKRFEPKALTDVVSELHNIN